MNDKLIESMQSDPDYIEAMGLLDILESKGAAIDRTENPHTTLLKLIIELSDRLENLESFSNYLARRIPE